MEQKVKRKSRALITQTHRGTEARCPCHGRLLGMILRPDTIEIKCGSATFAEVVLPEPNAEDPQK